VRGTALLVVVLCTVAAPGIGRAVDAQGLERRAQAFYRMLETGKRSEAGRVWQPLERDIASDLATLQADLDRMREDVIDRDGDLEALYESPRYREPEVASLVLAYHLSWVRYQGAQLTTDKKKRSALLRQAVEGFSQFTIVDDVPEIYAESLYGRGLSFMDLGDYGKAIADLQAAAGLSRTGRKAKTALDEARRLAAGGKRATAPPTPDELLAKMTVLLPKAARGDAAAEKEATELARGLAASGGAWPTKVVAAVTKTLGDGAPTTVRSSYGLALLGQIAVDRKRCVEVPALAKTGRGVEDAGRARHLPHLLFLEAGCALNGGDPAKAAALFDEIATEFPKSTVAADAGYFRFRALDTVNDDPAAIRAAAEAYLGKFGREARANEVRFLLAERLRATDDCAAAHPLYDGVTSGPDATRARLGALECDVAALGADATADQRRAVATALRDFASKTKPTGDATESVARAVLLAALVSVSGPEPDRAAAAELLAGYEKRFPEQAAWHGIARATRLESLVLAGRVADAKTDVDAILAEPIDAETAKLLARIAGDLSGPTKKDVDPTARELARRIWTALAETGSDPSARLRVAALALDSGDAAEARRLYDAALADDPESAEARRGAARAAAAMGDTTAALAHWRQIVETSKTGGTAWYEARLEQIDLLVADDHRAEACQILRQSRGFASTTGGDVLEAQLRKREPDVCR